MRLQARLDAAGESGSATASPDVETRCPRAREAALGGIVAATLMGCFLRVVMARGDLWLDEAWSLKLVSGLSSPWAVFWALSHDNNHFLNSFWLCWLGPDQPAWAYRVPAVAFGTLAVPLAAATAWRRSRAGAVVAAWFVALSMPMVVYGSEARGYAGLVASSLAAIAAFGPALDGVTRGSTPWRGRAAWVLAVAIGFGTLCHLTMLAILAVLGLAAALRWRSSGRPLARCIDLTTTLFGPAFVCLLPAMAAVMAGIVHCGGFAYGDVEPFAVSDFVAGFGGMLRAVLGLWDGLPSGLVFLGAGLLVLAALTPEGLDPLLRWTSIAALGVLPAGMAALRFPNLHHPRYFLVPGLVILLLEADVVGRLWDRGSRSARVLAASVLFAATVGHATADLSAVAVGRGASGEALAIMAREGRPAYASDNRFWSETVAEVAAKRQHTTLVYIPGARFCADPPDWYIVTDAQSAAPAALTVGPGPCAASFVKRATFPTATLSGMRWILYRRSGRASSSGLPA